MRREADAEMDRQRSSLRENLLGKLGAGQPTGAGVSQNDLQLTPGESALTAGSSLSSARHRTDRWDRRQ